SVCLRLARQVARLPYNLRGSSLRRFEKQVVIALRVERGIEIDQIHARVRNVLAQHVEVVAVVELVHCAASFSIAPNGIKRGLCLCIPKHWLGISGNGRLYLTDANRRTLKTSFSRKDSNADSGTAV